MNRLLVGLTLLLCSAIIYGATLISAAVYAENQKTFGWSSSYGLFGTALKELGTVPIIISILSAITGLLFIVDTLRKK
jgi:hypothetical protein